MMGEKISVIFIVIGKSRSEDSYWLRLKGEKVITRTGGFQISVNQEEFEAVQVGDRFQFKEVDFYA